ncbi:MAG: carbohydrate binding domain-containing protein [Lentisphaerota bacterium]
MSKYIQFVPASLLAVFALVSPVNAADPTTLASFDIPAPNNVGGGFGAFSPKAEEATFITVETLDDKVKQGAEGASMRLDYNVGKPGAFNGFWMKLGPEDVANNFDASAFTKMTFFIKGDTAIGIPGKVKVEIKGDPGTPIGRHYVSTINDDWTKIEVPLKEMTDQRVDLTKLNEVVFVFENAQAAPGVKGSIWIDDIKFE